MKQMQTWLIDLVTSASCTSCVYWSMFLFIIMFLSVTKLYVLTNVEYVIFIPRFCELNG